MALEPRASTRIVLHVDHYRSDVKFVNDLVAHIRKLVSDGFGDGEANIESPFRDCAVTGCISTGTEPR